MPQSVGKGPNAGGPAAEGIRPPSKAPPPTRKGDAPGFAWSADLQAWTHASPFGTELTARRCGADMIIHAPACQSPRMPAPAPTPGEGSRQGGGEDRRRWEEGGSAPPLLPSPPRGLPLITWFPSPLLPAHSHAVPRRRAFPLLCVVIVRVRSEEALGGVLASPIHTPSFAGDVPRRSIPSLPGPWKPQCSEWAARRRGCLFT